MSVKEKPEKSSYLPTVITILMALISLGLGVSNWLSQRDSQWEAARALVNIDIAATSYRYSPTQKVAHVEVVIANVGNISFLIRDIQFDFVTTGNIKINWDDVSLLNNNQVRLPLRLQNFVKINSDEKMAQFSFDTDKTAGSWHIVDPNRTIRIPIVVPLQGSGVLAINTILFSHAVSLMDLNNDINKYQMVNGRVYNVSPEHGLDQDHTNAQHNVQENMLIYPFSASQVLVVTDTTP